MRKTISLLLSVLIVLGVWVQTPFSAASAEIGDILGAIGVTGNCMWSLSDSGVLTISGNGTMGGYPQWNCDDVHSVVIEYGVSDIGESAFYGCCHVSSITLPSSVSSIGNSAFENCTDLTRITIPNLVTFISYNAFSGCPNLTIYGRQDSYARSFAQNQGIRFVSIVSDGSSGDCSWTLDENGTLIISGSGEIEPYPQWDNTAVRKAVIENGVTYIGDNAFSNCRNLSEVSVADSVTGIGEQAFWGCYNLQRLVVPDSVTQIAWNAFDNCGGLTLYGSNSSYARSFANDRCIPFVSAQSSGTCGSDCHWSLYENGLLMISGGSQISGYPQWNTDMVTEVIIENGVTRIDSYAFDECRQLSSISIPDSLCYIGYHAFENCCRLKTITLPDSVSYIDPNAFNGCGDLTIICNRYSYAEYFANDHGFKSVVTVGRGTSGDCVWLLDDKGVLTVSGFGMMSDYPQWDRSLVTKAVIENGVSAIGMNAFADCYNMRSVAIPNSVGYIDTGAFNGCSDLTITCDQGSYAETFARNNSLNVVVVIGRGTSGNCEWVLEDTGVLTVSGIGEMTVYPAWNRTAVTNAVIEDGVSEIGCNAFADCYNMRSITIPNSVTSIDPSAFTGCGNLTVICGQGSCAETFAIDRGLQLVTVGTSGDCRWELDSNGLFTVSGADTIAGYPQWNRLSVTKAVIEDGVSGIGYNAFADCHNMKSLTIPNSVTCIESGAFIGCFGLTIICKQGSFAETFANDYGFEAVIVVDSGTYGDCAWVLDNNGVLTVSGTGEITGYPQWDRLAVTKAVIEYGVFRIGCNAFADCTHMSSVTIPGSVEFIDSRAFQNCSALTSITIPSSVSFISSDAFEGCESLTTIYGFENSCVPSVAGYRFKPILITCSVCGLYLTEDNLVDLPDCPATCTVDGYCNKRVCPDCGEAYEFTRIPALGHRTVTDRAVAPTCTKSGLSEGSHCGRCGEVIKITANSSGDRP